MKRLLSIVLLFTLLLTAQSFETLWSEVTQFENQSLPKSALKKIDEIYKKAKIEKNEQEFIKALLHKKNYLSRIEGRGYSRRIKEVEEILTQTPSKNTKLILTSILASMYQSYLDMNRYRIQHRTAIKEGKSTDLETWSVTKLSKKISSLYLDSLDKSTQKVPIANYSDILSEGRYNKELRPTLYDFLAFRALQHFSNSRDMLSEPSHLFKLTDRDAFSSIYTFIYLSFHTPNRMDSRYQSLLIFQKLLEFHLAEHHKKALEHINLARLAFIHKNFEGEDGDKHYTTALKKMIKKSPKSEALLSLSEYYYYKKEFISALKYAKQGLTSNNEYLIHHSKKIKSDIESKELGFEIEQISLSHENLLAKVGYRNSENLFIKVIKLTPDEEEKLRKQSIYDKIPYIQSLYAFKHSKVVLPKSNDYKKHSTEISLGSYDKGVYLFVLSSNKKIDNHSIYKTVHISNIAYLKRGSKKIVIVHRKTGQPLKGVKVSFYKHRYNRTTRENEKIFITSKYSDKEGKVELVKSKDRYSMVFQYKEDKLNLMTLNYYSDYENNREREHSFQFVNFFTDRAIYRPNQTIYFKGLAVQRSNQKAPKVLKNRDIKVIFYDRNYQPIEHQTFRTDEFGTFHGTFTAPSSGLLGRMSLKSEGIEGSKQIQVEEYKRPKFEVDFNKLNKSYRLGDAIQVTGEAKGYAGNMLDGVTVKYRIKRTVNFPWRREEPYINGAIYSNPYKPSSSNIISSGEVTTDKNGNFTINFKAETDKNIDKSRKPNYDYKISVDVTDTTGESHSAVKHIHLGTVAVLVNLKIPKELNVNEKKSLIIEATNLDGKEQIIEGEIIVQKILPQKKILRKRYWSKIDKPLYKKEAFEKLFSNYSYNYKPKKEKKYIRTLSFNTQKSKEVLLKNLKTGEYLLTVKSYDSSGIELSKEQKITIYNIESSTPTPENYLWQKLDKESYTVPSHATLYLKSPMNNLPILLSIKRMNGQTQERWIRVQELTQELIKVNPNDKGDILYQINFIQNNRPYQKMGKLSVPWRDKLKVEYLSFRDKLKPNEPEQWKIKISGEGKESVMAQMVATIYDASLDEIRANSFALSSLFPTNRRGYNQGWRAEHFQALKGYQFWQEYTPQKEIYRVFPHLKWLNNSRYSRSYGEDTFASSAGAMVMEESVPVPMPSPVVVAPRANSRVQYASPTSNYTTNIETVKYSESEERDKEQEDKKPIKMVTIRKDFNETLLFKPDLLTDKEGNIIISFKTNEALTRWNLLGFIHTKNLQTAITRKSFITQKELMVVTNLPRFFRERDTITISAKVVNMSDKDLTGECELQLVNPVDEQPIFNHPFKKSFSVAKGTSTPIEFTIKVPDIDKITAIKHTLIARTKTHSDAEQIVVPILSNRTFITESKVLSIKGNEEKHFTLESLKKSTSSTLKHHKLTLEFTSNPAWYAIKSLPYLMEYEHECSEQLFSRYYANALAQNIANKTPKIKAIFESWRAKGQLKSQFSRNPELKSILLEETPWVLEAQSEEEQQKNIALLFDLHRVAEEQKKALTKLKKRQLSSGGWSWFGGNHPNRYISQYILEGMGHLKVLGVETPSHNMITKALTYIDSQIVKDYNTLLKAIENGYGTLEDDNLNPTIIHYLYVRSFFQEKMESQTQVVHNYYLEQVQKYWQKRALYEKGLIALALNRLGYDAKPIVASIKEHSIESDEFGAYFSYTNGFYWNELPIETHTLMIEVFETITKDKEMVEKLKTWLLKQRQTTHWKTTKATTSAIYALLSNSDWLDNDRLVEVEFETTKNYQNKLQKAQSQAVKGLGYYKVNYNPNEFDTSMATIKVKNPNSTIAWGGLYWQYFEDMDKVKSFKETPLTIEKKIFLLEQNNQGKQLIPITHQLLKIGDKVKVRIEIRVDRAMEYIMLKDSRASAFEPLDVISQYKWQDGLGYYQSTKDNATYFFIDYLPKGTYIFEYPLVVTHRGNFSNGITTMESMYAPEFKSHSEGIRVEIQ